MKKVIGFLFVIFISQSISCMVDLRNSVNYHQETLHGQSLATLAAIQFIKTFTSQGDSIPQLLEEQYVLEPFASALRKISKPYVDLAALISEPLIINHDDPVNSAQFSPDSSKVVTASEDKTTKITDAATGMLIATINHDAWVKSAQFSPDGSKVVTVSLDKTAKIQHLMIPDNNNFIKFSQLYYLLQKNSEMNPLQIELIKFLDYKPYDEDYKQLFNAILALPRLNTQLLKKLLLKISTT